MIEVRDFGYEGEPQVDIVDFCNTVQNRYVP